MKTIKKAFLIVLLPLLAFTMTHKFYLSVTSVKYSEKSQALQITTRIFIDDLDKLLLERYGLKSNLATKTESDEANIYIEEYLKTKFAVAINGKAVAYDYLGKSYDNDVVICYIEIPKIDLNTVSSIAVQNQVLMDVFEEQKNVVHFSLLEDKKSFVLIRENNKGMLNLK